MNKKFLFAVIAATIMGNAWADDGRILTTQTYVDNELSGKVDITQGTGDNDENVGKTLVVNSQGNLELGTVSADNFVSDSITDGVTNMAPSENAVHDALENKQNTIATGMLDFNDDWELPAITTYDTTDGLVANKIGILDRETIADDEGNLGVYSTNEYGAQMDNYVPTVRAVADELNIIWTAMPTSLDWSSSLQAPINNYNITFSSSSNTWPDYTQNQVPTVETFANALALKQNTIATGMVDFNNGAADLPAITTYDTTGGLVANKIGILDQETIADDDGNLGAYNTNDYGAQMDNYVPTVRAVADGLNSIRDDIWNEKLNWSSSLQTPINNYSTTFSSNSDTWPNYREYYLPTVETFANGLALKQNKIPAGTAGDVVTYTGTEGVVGSVATYTGAATYNATNDANKIPTMSGVTAWAQAKKVCVRWLDTPEHPEHNDENCLLWELPD